jgi:hypothetical protein
MPLQQLTSVYPLVGYWHESGISQGTYEVRLSAISASKKILKPSPVQKGDCHEKMILPVCACALAASSRHWAPIVNKLLECGMIP